MRIDRKYLNSENCLFVSVVLLILLTCLPITMCLPTFVRQALQILAVILFFAGLLLYKDKKMLLYFCVIVLVMFFRVYEIWKFKKSFFSCLFSVYTGLAFAFFGLISYRLEDKQKQKNFLILLVVLTTVTALTTLIGIEKYPLVVRELGRSNLSYSGVRDNDFALMKWEYRIGNIAGWNQLYGMVFLIPGFLYLFKKSRNVLVLLAAVVCEYCVYKSQITFAILISLPLIAFSVIRFRKKRSHQIIKLFLLIVMILLVLNMDSVILFLADFTAKGSLNMVSEKLYDFYAMLHGTNTGDVQARIERYAYSWEIFKQHPIFGQAFWGVSSPYMFSNHSDFFDMLGFYGIVGCLALIVVAVRYAGYIIAVGSYEKWLTLVLGVGFVAMYVFNPIWYSPQIFIGVFMFPALLSCVYQGKSRRKSAAGQNRTAITSDNKQEKKQKMIKDSVKKIIGPKATELVVRLKYLIYNFICSFYPMQKEIILESFPDFSCNTFELYRYMIRHDIQKQYKITWLTDGTTKPLPKEENVFCLNMFPKGFREKFRYYLRCNRAQIVITCNRHITKRRVSRRQLNIYLDHGSQLKSVLTEKGKRKDLQCDYMICQSPFFVRYNTEQYTVSEDQVVSTGLPRNDQLFYTYHSLDDLIPEHSSYKKIILWVPTFRQHQNKTRLDCKHSYPLGLPILNSPEDAEAVNRVLKDQKVLLLIKPHPAQNLEVIRALDLSNIRYIYNSDLMEKGIQTNELLAQTDAMITDYSSIYYDYLLLHRPIALTLDDFDDYARDKGFVFDKPLEILKGDYLYTVSDLCRFIENTAHDRDERRTEREEICDKLHVYQDANSSERVCQFIMEEARKRFKE
ncbi:MAG: CDP-glycerol glycerophosphotransferase family protein [Lachnospiraceae bacterium]|nr:CDP-glycerol glycerophosphotransferase family protein [Lachnospiraceae bacterium]